MLERQLTPEWVPESWTDRQDLALFVFDRLKNPMKTKGFLSTVRTGLQGLRRAVCPAVLNYEDCL